MALIDTWLPPTREHYDILLTYWQLAYPALASLQWVVKWYGMGKTSVASRFNIPGRVAWVTMECPGFLTMVYIMRTGGELPWQNLVLAGLYVIHYLYRAVLFPLLQPSMSPIHPLVWSAAILFQLCNATCLASWLALYGPVTDDAWAGSTGLYVLGVGVFYLGLAGSFMHDEELREIRRRRAAKGVGVDKYYEMPRGGLFEYVLYPHYLCEWVEWAGFWMAAGWGCVPARAFLVNEVVSMLPRTVSGRRWYVDRFGRDKVGRRKAVIPGLI